MDSIDILSLIVGFAAIIFVYFWWSYKYWEKRNVPYIPPRYFSGNFEPPLRRNISQFEKIIRLYNYAKSQGWKYCGIYNITKPLLLVLDLDLLKSILTKDFNHFVDRGQYVNEKDDPLSAHLFSIGGEKWRNLRVKFTPTFTSGKMRQMFQTVSDCGLTLEKYLEEEVHDKKPIDIKTVAACYTTDIIGSCAFGIECNTFKEPDSPFRSFGQKIFERGRLGLLKLSFIFGFPKLAEFLRLKITPDDVTKFFMKVVNDTIEYRMKNNVVRKDFLQSLIELRAHDQQDHKNEIAAQSFIFFIAGFETSSTTMTFALYELATHPEIQEKAREEILQVLKRHDNKFSYDAVNELVYLKQVIDEALRKYPALPLVTRVCVKDYKIPGTDVVIEEGTKIIVPIAGIHHDDRYYEDPEKFDPDRFTEANKEQRHPYANLSFGEGPRICIGMRFGIMQTKVGLASILKNYRVSLNEKTKTPLKISIRSFIPTTDGGMWLTMEKI
nr:unnamed protein product [Callosobruchus analis]